jgi:macrodomain Ter protein organizer (MatP/YcbG family)
MANSRSKDKRHLNAWIWETDHKVLARVAKENGMTLTDLVEYLIGELRKKEPKEIQKWKNKKQND